MVILKFVYNRIFSIFYQVGLETFKKKNSFNTSQTCKEKICLDALKNIDGKVEKCLKFGCPSDKVEKDQDYCEEDGFSKILKQDGSAKKYCKSKKKNKN